LQERRVYSEVYTGAEARPSGSSMTFDSLTYTHAQLVKLSFFAPSAFLQESSSGRLQIYLCSIHPNGATGSLQQWNLKPMASARFFIVILTLKREDIDSWRISGGQNTLTLIACCLCNNWLPENLD